MGSVTAIEEKIRSITRMIMSEKMPKRAIPILEARLQKLEVALKILTKRD